MLNTCDVLTAESVNASRILCCSPATASGPKSSAAARRGARRGRDAIRTHSSTSATRPSAARRCGGAAAASGRDAAAARTATRCCSARSAIPAFDHGDASTGGPRRRCSRSGASSASTRTCGRPASGRASKHAGPLKPEVARRHRHARRARADRRALLRRAARHAATTAASALNTMRYSRAGDRAHRARRVRRGARAARKRVTSVDKANVLETSRLWRQVVTDVAPSYPDVDARPHVRRRVRDEAGARAGALRRHAHREPVRRHPVGRSRRDRRIARPAAVGEPRRRARACSSRCTARRRTSPGRDIANPIGAIASAAMLLRHGARTPRTKPRAVDARDRTRRLRRACGPPTWRSDCSASTGR